MPGAQRDASASPSDAGGGAAAAGRARFRLGAGRRLARKDDFERLLRSGARRSRLGYTFFVAARASGPARLGILVSRRHSPKATVRNGMKRCIREAFRLEHPGLASLDILVRPPYGARPGPAMLRTLRALMTEFFGGRP